MPTCSAPMTCSQPPPPPGPGGQALWVGGWSDPKRLASPRQAASALCWEVPTGFYWEVPTGAYWEWEWEVPTGAYPIPGVAGGPARPAWRKPRWG